MDELPISQTEAVAVTQAVDGRFRLKISINKMAVYLSHMQAVSGTGKHVTAAMVLEKLKDEKIVYGIDNQRIDEILTALNSGKLASLLQVAVNAQADPDESPALCICRGEPVEDGGDGIFSWCVSEQAINNGGYLARKYELLATYVPATQGLPGKTVFGRALPAQRGREVGLSVGDGIASTSVDGQLEYRADRMGRVSLNDNCISIEPLVRISDDAMMAEMDIYRRSGNGQAILLDDILSHITMAGVKYGVDVPLISEAMNQVVDEVGGSKNIRIAVGASAIAGMDARLHIQHKEQASGMELANGRIDLKELSYPWSVAGGELLGRVTHAKPAVSGMTVKGVVIPVKAAKDISLDLTGIVEDEQGRLHAEKDGTLLINGTKLSVVELFLVNGDVDQKLGNVHCNAAVHVKGYVNPGFSVTTEKGVIVDQNIEDAMVTAAEGVVVNGGIRGGHSKVNTQGDLSVGFIESAEIVCKGNVTVKRTIINSDIRCEGSIQIGSKQSKASTIIGGQIQALIYIDSISIGSPSYAKTLVRLGMSVDQQASFKALKDKLDDKEKSVLRLNQVEAQYKDNMTEGGRDLMSKLVFTREALSAEIVALNEEKLFFQALIESAAAGQIIIRKSVFPGVVIDINDHLYKVKDELGSGVFRLVNNSVVFEVV